MAYNAKQWETVRAFFERGLSLADIVARDEVAIKSKSQISKRAAKDGWIKNEKETFLLAEIAAKATLSDIKRQKETLTSTELIVHNILVIEATERAEWLNTAAIRNVQEAMDCKCENQNDYKTRADTICKAKESIFGKAPTTAIQVNTGPKTTFDPTKMSESALEELLNARYETG